MVQFGPEPEHNFIQNVTIGEKMMLKKKGRSHVVEVDFIKTIKFCRRLFEGGPAANWWRAK